MCITLVVEAHAALWRTENTEIPKKHNIVLVCDIRVDKSKATMIR